MAALTFGDVGQIVSVPEVVPYDEFRRSRFYVEWAEPQGWVDVAVAVLDKSAGGWGFLGVSRNAANGMVDDEMRRRIALVVPHIRRALRIGRAIERRQADAATFADVLDRLSAGLLLLDAQGRIVHTNVAADDMLRDGRLLRAIGRRLAGGDRAGRAGVARDRDPAARRGPRPRGRPRSVADVRRRAIHRPRDAAGERGAARRRRDRRGDDRRVRAAGHHGLSVAPDVIAESYKLTPTELRVLFALVEVAACRRSRRRSASPRPR